MVVGKVGWRNKYGAAAPTGGGFLGTGCIPHWPTGQVRVSPLLSSPQFLGMGPTHSPPKKRKKAGTQSRACTSNTGGPQPTAVAHTGQTRRAWVIISGSVGGCSGPRPARTPLRLRVGAWGGRGVHLQAQVDDCTSAPGVLLAGGRSATQSQWGYYGAPSTARFGQGCHQFADRAPRLQCVGGGPPSPRQRKGHWAAYP